MNTYPKYGKSNDMNMPLNSYGMNVMLNNSFSKLLFDIINVEKIGHICTKEVLNNEINNVIDQFKNLTITSPDTPILVDISEVFNNIDLKYIKNRPILCDNYSPLCGVISSNNPKDIIATDIKINSEKIYNVTLVLSEKYDFKLIMDPLFDNRVTGLPIYLCILKDSYKLVISNSTNVLIITKCKNQDRFAYAIYTTVSDGKHMMSESYMDYSYPRHDIEEPIVSNSPELCSYDEDGTETEYKHNVMTTKYSHNISEGFVYEDIKYRNLVNMNSRVKVNYIKTIMDASDIGGELSNVADIMVNSYDDSTAIKYELIKNNTTVFYDNNNNKEDFTECKSIVEKLITECKSTIKKIKYNEDLKEIKLYKESVMREILSKATDIKYITLTKLLREELSSKEKEDTSIDTVALAIRVVYYINDNIAELIVYHTKNKYDSWLSSTIVFDDDKDVSHSYSIVNTKYKGYSNPEIVRSFIKDDINMPLTYAVQLLNYRCMNLYDIPNKLVYCVTTKPDDDKFTVDDMENILVLKNKMSSSKEIIVKELK